MATTEITTPRRIHQIASDIRKHWANVNYAAEPYLRAMETLNGIQSMYGCDSAESIILYFLSNASSFRGEDARRLKKELNDLLKT